MSRPAKMPSAIPLFPDSSLGIIVGLANPAATSGEPVIRPRCFWPPRARPARWTSRFREDAVRMTLRRLK